MADTQDGHQDRVMADTEDGDFYLNGGTTETDTDTEEEDDNAGGMTDTDEEDDLDFLHQRMVKNILWADDIGRFLSLINVKVHYRHGLMVDYTWKPCQERLLGYVWIYPAVKCATALLNGDTFIQVDVNCPDESGLYPLHRATLYGSASMIELLLSHGARTDVRCKNDAPEFYLKLPLQLAFTGACMNAYLKKCADEKSVLKVVASLCTRKVLLENLRVLTWRGKEAEQEFLSCIRHGDLIKLAGLLMVAHRKLIPGLMKADWETADKPVRQLLLVFEKAGDAIDAYCRKHEDDDVSVEQRYTDVARLLQEVGISIEHLDTRPIVYPWMSLPSWTPVYDTQRLPKEYREASEKLTVVQRQRTATPVESGPLIRNPPMKNAVGAECHLHTTTSKKRWISSCALRFIKRI